MKELSKRKMSRSMNKSPKQLYRFINDSVFKSTLELLHSYQLIPCPQRKQTEEESVCAFLETDSISRKSLKGDAQLTKGYFKMPLIFVNP